MWMRGLTNVVPNFDRINKDKYWTVVGRFCVSRLLKVVKEFYASMVLKVAKNFECC